MDEPKSMTGLIDSLILANLGSKDDHSGSYEKGTAAKIAAVVQIAYPERELKVLKGLFYSRRAVVSKKVAEKAAKAAEKELAAA